MPTENPRNSENTDFDRLDDSFNALIQRGIFCVHDVHDTPSSCWATVNGKLDVYKQAKKAGKTVHFDPESIWAVAFYHFQDTEKAAAGMPLTISYIAMADGEQEKTDLMRAKFLIMGMFRQFGLKVIDPSFDPGIKIFLEISWQIPLQRIASMEENRGRAIEYAKNSILDMPLEEYKKMIEGGAENLNLDTDNCAHEKYYVGKLLDLAVDDGAIDKKTFILEKLKECVEIKSLIFSNLADAQKETLRSMAAMRRFYDFNRRIPEEAKKRVKLFADYESTKQAVELLGGLFNVRRQPIVVMPANDIDTKLVKTTEGGMFSKSNRKRDRDDREGKNNSPNLL